MDVTPSSLIGSLAQSVLQQRDAAAPQDSARGRADRLSQRLRQISEKQAEAVEDYYDATDDHDVNEDGGGQGGPQQHFPQKQNPQNTLDIQA